MLPTNGGKILITSRHTADWPQDISIDVFTIEDSRDNILKALDTRFAFCHPIIVFLYKLSDKEHSRSAGSVLGKCIYFWKVLVETSSTVYIIAAPIEVKGPIYLNSAHEAESNDIQHDPVRTIPEGTPSTHRASMYIF